jgi:hypothetical protein
LYSRDAIIIEIFQCKNNHLNHYKNLAEQKKLKYIPLFLDGKFKNDDVDVNLNVLKSFLENKI